MSHDIKNVGVITPNHFLISRANFHSPGNKPDLKNLHSRRRWEVCSSSNKHILGQISTRILTNIKCTKKVETIRTKFQSKGCCDTINRDYTSIILAIWICN